MAVVKGGEWMRGWSAWRGSPERKMPETRAGEGAVLRLMYLVCAFAGINMQSGARFLPSGMNGLEKSLAGGA